MIGIPGSCCRPLAAQANGYWRDLKQTVLNWLDHDGSRLGASLSLYTLLSLAPLVILSIALASLAFGRHAAETAVIGEVRSVMGADGARAIRTVIEHGIRPGAGSTASAIGLIIMLIGASSVVGELQSAAHLSLPRVLLALIDALISFGGIFALLGLIFRYVPDVPLRWRDVWQGALATDCSSLSVRPLSGCTWEWPRWDRPTALPDHWSW